MKKKSIQKKIKCLCGCATTFYISLNDKGTKDETLFIGSYKDSTMSFEDFLGVQVDRKELLKMLK